MISGINIKRFTQKSRYKIVKVFLPFLLWHLAMGQKTHHIRELTRRTCTRYQEREGLRLHFSIGYIRKCLLEIGHLHLLWRILCLVVCHYKTINQFCNNEYQNLTKKTISMAINGENCSHLYFWNMKFLFHPSEKAIKFTATI